MNRHRRWLAAAALMAVAAGMTGCTSTYQARKVEPSGFLGDYAQLEKGDAEKQEALLRYVDPTANFKQYDKIMIDPVRIYAQNDSSLAKLEKEDQQRLVNYLDAVLREKLKEDYTIVDKPGPGILRIRTAITDARGARVALDTFSTVMPIGLAVSEAKRITTGSHTSIGSAAVECEGLDSVSGKRLFASVDARVGRKMTGKFDKFKKYRTPEDSFDYWANRLKERLKEEREKKPAASRPA